MKKIVNMSFIYAILGLLSGLFYREFTRAMDFSGETVLSVTHTHLLSLGMIFLLIILALAKLFPLTENRKFKKFWILYNIGLLLTVIMMYIRGIHQVLETDLSVGIDAAIAGFAGIGHIFLTLAIIYLFLSLRNVVAQSS